jgi:DNA-directed RNA polymerase subunit beta
MKLKSNHYVYSPINSFQIPNFLNLQRSSFQEFLKKGLVEEFKRYNPITNHNKTIEIFFHVDHYKLNRPKWTPKQAILKRKSYACELYIPVQLTNRKSNEISFQWILIANMPLMTKNGHFILNGSPRVVMNQMIRSPGVYFQRIHTLGKKKIYCADFIAQRGAWLRLEVDTKKGEIWAKLKKTPKIPIYIFLRSLGLSVPILNNFLDILRFKSTSQIKNEGKGRSNLKLGPFLDESLKHPKLQYLVEDLRGVLMKRATVRKKKLTRKVKHERILALRDKWAGNDYLYPTRSANLREFAKGLSSKKWLIKSPVEQTETFLFKKFLNSRTYDLSVLGRARINKKLGISIPFNHTTLTAQDVLFTCLFLMDLLQGLGTSDDIDDLKNRKLRPSGELIQTQLAIGFLRLEKLISEKLENTQPFHLQLDVLLDVKPINQSFREFFGTSPLSQLMDQTNALAEITHKRRLSSLGPGGINRETAGMAIRGIHPTHYGRICPIETPEGQNAGLVNSITTYAHLNTKGFLETPFYKTYKGFILKNVDPLLFSSDQENKWVLAPGDVKVSRFHFLPQNVSIPARYLKEFKRVSRQKIHFVAMSPIQMISVATSLIPFLEHDDGNRALMGSNMQRQAVPTIRLSKPIVGTGLESRVISDVGHGLQAKKSGFVSYVDGKKIIIYSQKRNSLFQSSLYSQSFPFVGKNRKKNSKFFNNGDQNQKIARFKDLFLSFDTNKLFFIYNNFYLDDFLGQLELINHFSSNFFVNKNPNNKDRTFFKKKNKEEMRKQSSISSLSFPNVQTKDFLSKRSFFLIQTFSKPKLLLSYCKFILNQSFFSLNFKTEKINSQIGTANKKSKRFIETFLKTQNFLPGTPKLKQDSPKPKYFKKNKINFLKYETINKSFFKPKDVEQVKILKTDKTFLSNQKKASSVDNSNLSPFEYNLDSYYRSNQDTYMVHRAVVHEGQWVEKGDLLADSSASKQGELAVGHNLLVGYTPWEGYNFEDAILISERLIFDDLYTSLHIERYDVTIKDTPFGLEQITNQIPNLDKHSNHLDWNGIAKIGSWVNENDILVGKVAPLGQKKLSPYENLLYDIIGKEIPKTKDTSLRVPKNVRGRVVHIEILETNAKTETSSSIVESITEETNSGNKERSLSEILQESKWFLSPFSKMSFSKKRNKKENKKFFFLSARRFKDSLLSPIELSAGQVKRNQITQQKKQILIRQVNKTSSKKMQSLFVSRSKFDLSFRSFLKKQNPFGGFGPPRSSFFSEHAKISQRVLQKKTLVGVNKNSLVSPIKVHIYLAEKRKLQVGDKMAGRHGNKGIISNILPREDMPYLPDGKPLDIVLNPLGVPSRMNVGQIFECLLGMAGFYLKQNYKIRPFDEIYGCEASRSLVYSKLYEARSKTGQNWLFNPNFPGKTRLFDGRTGEIFEQPVTVGFAYILKLIHLVDDKIHARSTGPYSLVTQQPLRGRSKQGGQRVGEMEVWALEGFGAAYILQEILTIKSDDLDGRNQIFNSIFQNDPMRPGIPDSFKVLVRELQSLCLDIVIYQVGETKAKRLKLWKAT